MAMYQATHYLGWSHAEFWDSTLIWLEESLGQANKAAKLANGKKSHRKSVMAVRYADQLPPGVW